MITANLSVFLLKYYCMSKNDKVVKWLEQRPLIKINKLLVKAGMDTGNASRAWEAKVIPEKYLPAVEKQLTHYGYK